MSNMKCNTCREKPRTPLAIAPGMSFFILITWDFLVKIKSNFYTTFLATTPSF